MGSCWVGGGFIHSHTYLMPQTLPHMIDTQSTSLMDCATRDRFESVDTRDFHETRDGRLHSFLRTGPPLFTFATNANTSALMLVTDSVYAAPTAYSRLGMRKNR